ncbi:MAG: prepilin peptidase [Treponema sp.]|nr:prepilin peptidase [Treponema sp.]
MLSSLSFIIILCFILISSVLLSVYDIRNFSVPLWALILGTVGFLVLRIIFYINTVYLYLISAAILTMLYFIIKLITHGKLGTGDILFGLFQGLGFRPQFIWICLAVEAVIGLIFFLICHYRKGNSSNAKKMPFIPFMACGLLVSFLIDCFC